MKKITTLCIIHEGQKVLLGMKKKGFGKGRWNGFGGKVNPNETIEECVRREMREESGLDIPIENFEKIGIIKFSFKEIPDILENHFFKVKKFSGNPIETDEMKPKWFHVDEIPLSQMWPDDVYWMPLFLVDQKFKGEFRFDSPSDSEYASKIIKNDLREVNNL
ncbi:MAG: 8-oxo-dGTP diphosphatase [Patescibacteria group bacterium]|jgi:8-oxo-dGTP diphosphatase/2-hydroxy-dATP diphosphatase|nr:8-oxo-dGTP diphosphatase [Patescibacteria group bacterium]